MKGMNKNGIEKYKVLLSRVAKIVDRPDEERNAKLLSICQLIDDEVNVFDWVGFYLVDPEAEQELVLGPYVGEATDHTRIPFGKGICGQAAESHETFVVQDVNQADNYLACSREVEAEIVVPVMKDGEFVAELDIDSHTMDSITVEHRQMLEEVCAIVAKLF